MYGALFPGDADLENILFFNGFTSNRKCCYRGWIEKKATFFFLSVFSPWKNNKRVWWALPKEPQENAAGKNFLFMSRWEMLWCERWKYLRYRFTLTRSPPRPLPFSIVFFFRVHFHFSFEVHWKTSPHRQQVKHFTTYNVVNHLRGLMTLHC